MLPKGHYISTFHAVSGALLVDGSTVEVWDSSVLVLVEEMRHGHKEGFQVAGPSLPCRTYVRATT
jgi:hypothetical protein